MRTTKERIHQAICFEIIGLLIVTPLGSWVFEMALANIAVVGLFSATIATIWNYYFNILFDKAMLRLYGSVQKRVVNRITHALLFEFGLLIILLPLIALYLQISLKAAFLMDIYLVVFYIVYTFIFTWIYDRLFPVRENVDYQKIRH